MTTMLTILDLLSGRLEDDMSFLLPIRYFQDFGVSIMRSMIQNSQISSWLHTESNMGLSSGHHFASQKSQPDIIDCQLGIQNKAFIPPVPHFPYLIPKNIGTSGHQRLELIVVMCLKISRNELLLSSVKFRLRIFSNIIRRQNSTIQIRNLSRI